MKHSIVILSIISVIMVSASCKKITTEERHIKFKTQNIFYTVRNPESNISCFLIHGFGDSQTSFDSIIPIFDSLYIKTIYFDLPGMSKNKSVKINFKDLELLFKEIYNKEKTTKNYAIGHSMGGLILLLSSIDNNLIFKRILTIEPSITKSDFDFFRYIQEKPIGIGLDSFINKPRELDGYTGTYIKNLNNSNTTQLKLYAKNIFNNFNNYTNTIFNSGLRFTYIFGRNSSGLDDRKQIGCYKNIDTISFKNAEHWVHYDAKDDFRKYLSNILINK